MEKARNSFEIPTCLGKASVERVCENLLAVLQNDGLKTEHRLGTLVVLNKLFTGDSADFAKTLCLKSDLVSFLLSCLDTGLMYCDKPVELMLAAVAMETLFHLSKMQVCLIQNLLTDGIARRLLAYLDTTEHFYKFADLLKTRLIELCEGRQLVGKVQTVAMSSDPLEYIHKHAHNSVKRLLHLPDHILLCHLYDTSSDIDLDILVHLLREGLVLAGQFPGNVMTAGPGDNWQEVVVTRVLDGPLFWAVVGEQNIKELFLLQEQLNGEMTLAPAQKLLLGNHVVVKGEILGNSCYVRAQVLALDGAVVHAVAIDYGYEIDASTSHVYQLPSGLDIESIPQKASLCSLADVHPVPLDQSLVQNSVAILSNLCKQSYLAATVISNNNGLKTLLAVLRCYQRSPLVSHILTLCCNLGCQAKTRMELAELDVISAILDVIRVQLLEEVPESTEEERTLVAARSLICLTCLMYNNLEARTNFYKHQGLDVVIQIVRRVGIKHCLYQLSVKLLLTFIGSAAVKLDDVTPATNAKSSPVKVPIHKDRAQEAVHNTVEGVTHSASGTEGQSSGCGPVRTVPSHSTGVLTGHLTRLKLGLKSLDQVSLSSESEEEQGPMSSLVHGSSHHHRDRRYILGQMVRFGDDAIHELLSNKHVATISEMTMAQHLCGMLNSGHRGSVYFGISKDQKVFGLEMSRDERDRMRLGVDILMFSKITPSLLHSQFEFTSYPVYETKTGPPIPDSFVIEVSVRANRGTIYTMTDGACYYRFGSDTEQISCLDLRKLVCLEEEFSYSDKISHLELQKSQLLQALHGPVPDGDM